MHSEEEQELSAAAIRASGFFDADYYRAQIALAGEAVHATGDAARHYHTVGWRHYCDPGPHFSTVGYLMNNEDVAAAAVDPLTHYLRYGRREGRRITPAPLRPSVPPSRAVPTVPSEEEWQELALNRRSRKGDVPIVDVVIPVFKGVAETLRCLFSVLSMRSSTPHRVVVIDDHAPDAAIVTRLKWLARQGFVHLVRSPQNGGFVRACNLGMSLSRERDIILLNSDTEVFGDWVDRLRRLAYREADIGTVTPFSNNAEICSYPALCRDTPFHIEIGDAELDGIMARENAEGCLDLPTGVGFCLFIRRDCLDDVGLLDVDTFGAGYGEENDFCQRASIAGWRNVLAPDVFVRHYGGSSFGASKAARVQAAIAAVERKHPGYLDRVADFIRADPVAAWRAPIDAARIRRRCTGRPTMLFVGHNRGGGTERHLCELGELLESFGVSVLTGRPNSRDPNLLCISDAQLRFQSNDPSFDLGDSPERLAQALKTFGIIHVHIHHLADFADSVIDYIRLACRAAAVPYDFTAHDYLCICPRVTLTDETGLYCGEPDVEGCRNCLRERGSEFGSPAIWEWRARYSRLLREARRVFVPADDVGRRLARYHPGVVFVTRPHLDAQGEQMLVASPVVHGSGLRHVGLIGAIGPHKGSEFLLRCAKRAQEREAAIRFTLIGYTDRDEDFAGCDNVRIEGAYLDSTLATRIVAIAPDILWFTALWPETFSYTLNAAFEAGVLPVAFDFGAIAERIRQTGFGHLLPIDLMFDVDATLDALLELDPAASLVPKREERVAYDLPLQSYYGLSAPLPIASTENTL